MKKFAVVSGFLGAGKTSVMMALTKSGPERRAPAAMISNDLGSGVTLADHRFAALSGTDLCPFRKRNHYNETLWYVEAR